MFFLRASVKPAIILDAPMKEAQKVKGGNNVNLYANIEGVPTPKVTWFHKDAELKSSNGISIDTKDTFTGLTIKGSTAKHSGTYKLVAENVAGKAETEFNVTVRGKIVEVTIVLCNLIQVYTGFCHQ